MTIQLTTFTATQTNCIDNRSGDFALAFEEKPRRAPFFGNIVVDAMWTSWLTHDAYPATMENAKQMLDGDNSPYPDSSMVVFQPEDASTVKKALATLMATWADGKSTVLGYSEEEDIALAYRDMGKEGFFVFAYCAYLEPDCIRGALESVGLASVDYQLIETEEERSGCDFLFSMRDNDPEWFDTLSRVGIIDEQCEIQHQDNDDKDD